MYTKRNVTHDDLIAVLEGCR